MQSYKFFELFLQNVSMFRMFDFLFFFFWSAQEDRFLSRMYRCVFYFSNAEKWNGVSFSCFFKFDF